MTTSDIIIVNYNSTHYAIRAIASLIERQRRQNYTITVVDNASIDNPGLIADLFPEVRLILNKKNLGFSKAINHAFGQTQGKYIVILNPDTIIVNGFLEKAIEYLDLHQDVGVLGPQILEPDGTVQGSARSFPRLSTAIFGRKSPITKMFPNNRFTKKEFPCFNEETKNQIIEVDWVSGACMVIRRSSFVAVNGFDESFFLYWEDTDICRRIKEAGCKIVYYPMAKMLHIVGVSSSTRPIHSIFHFHQSCFKLFRKYSRNSKAILIPFVLFGLSVRCMLVIILNYVSGLLKAKKN